MWCINNKKNITEIFFTRPSKEISTKMHLLELSTMIHVVRKQIKCILVNERPRDLICAPCLPEREWGRTRNTIFAGTRKSKARNSFAQQLIRSTCVQSDSHLSVQSALYKYIFYHKSSPQNNGTHEKVIQQ